MNICPDLTKGNHTSYCNKKDYIILRGQNPVLTKLKTKSLLAASLSLNPSIFLSQANDVSRQIVPLCCVSIINERAQQHRYYRAKNKRQQINTKVFRFFLLLFFNRLKYLGPMSIMNTA